MKPLQDDQERSLRVRGRHRVIGAILILTGLVLAFPPLFEHSRDPKATEGEESASHPAVSPPVPHAPTTPATGIRLPDHPAKDVPVLLPSPAAGSVAVVTAVKPPATANSSEKPKEVPHIPPGPTQEKPSETPAAKVSGEAGVLLQVGVFASPYKANMLTKKLRKHGFRVISEEVNINGNKRLRIRVGPYPTRAKARKTIDQLKTLGVQSMVVAP